MSLPIDDSCPRCGGTIITTPTRVASSVGTGAPGLSTSPPTCGSSCSILTVTRTWLDDGHEEVRAIPWHGYTAREACASRYRRLRDVGDPASIKVDETTLKLPPRQYGESALVETLHWVDVEESA